MATLKELNLKYNPFKDITASFVQESPKWAGMEEVKVKIERSYNDCISNRSKQVILNWGQYGGGKTFSAYYFIKQYENNTQNITHIYVRAPKEGSKATDELFKSIIDQLTFEKIQNQVKFIIEAKGEQFLFDFLAQKIGQEYAKAICLINSSDQDVISIIKRFLYVGLTKTELKKIGLAKDIQSDTDSIKFLSGIISCFIGDSDFVDGRVFFWLDEMEDLIYYPPKYYKAFSQVLRDLFDSVNESFAVFLNFTLSEGEESTIEQILGGAVWSRITKKIRYKQFTTEDAIKYCKDLLSFAKVDNDVQRPFTEIIIQRVLSVIPSFRLTPREINKHFSSLISYSLEQDIVEVNEGIFASWVIEYQEDN